MDRIQVGKKKTEDLLNPSGGAIGHLRASDVLLLSWTGVTEMLVLLALSFNTVKHVSLAKCHFIRKKNCMLLSEISGEE